MTGVQTCALPISFTDMTIFSTEIQVQLASSIGYPTVTTNSITIDLEAGWKYFIELKMKVSDSTPSASENFQFRMLDNSSNVISSIGSIAISIDTAAYIQEKCIAYIDATSSAQTFKFQAIKVPSGSNNINTSVDAGNTDFRSHFLIKAWK